jgi:glycosyltransferase involved in cell wall biosynthesis
MSTRPEPGQSRSGNPVRPALAFSVIVPTYNRAAQLRRCLESLAAQDYPRDRCETIVVDDGSSEPLDEIVKAFDGRLQLRLLRQSRTGPGPARNAGARAARGKWLAFTDDDCRPETGWLTALDRVLSTTGRRAAGGRTVNALGESRYSHASQALVSYLYVALTLPGGGPRFFASNNLALPADVFLEAGAFDTTVPLYPAEDRDLCERLEASGCQLVEASDAVVRHAHPLTFRGFCRQHFVYGRGALRYHRLRATRRRDRVRIEPATFYLNLLRHPFRTRDERPWSTAALLALSQVMHTAGFFWERVFPRGDVPASY